MNTKSGEGTETGANADKVLLLKRSGYGQAGIDSAVEEVFDFFGGVGQFVAPGARVLLKVNLVAGHEVERRVTTDPSVVRAVGRLVLRAGGRPVIGDSPGIDNFQRAAEKAGLADVGRELGIPCTELTDPVPLPTLPGASFHKIEVARLALESDVVINLPKMKTHGQMLLTLGVKNIFGCVVGQRKAEWHFNVGFRREKFASLLLDIWKGIGPALTLLDGVVGMDGYGPTSGRPFPYGVVGGARNALAMDFWLCRMMGVPLEDYPLWRAARGMRLEEGGLAGDFDFLPAGAPVWQGVNIPRLQSLSLLPTFLPFGKKLEQALTSRPVQRPKLCAGCGKCASICPAEAISLRDKTVTFDYKKCIRCYCCHEMCPAAAIEFKDGLLMKAARYWKGGR
jgi:uncharacterized protein (DUF362 family)/ferredoxin